MSSGVDFQHREGSKTGSGGLLSESQAAIERKERLRKLALETIDISKDPYFMRNHLGTFECKLCLTLHPSEGNYLAHTQGKRHQSNLGRRAAMEAKNVQSKQTTVQIVPKRQVMSIGRPGYKVSKSRDMITKQRSLTFEIDYSECAVNVQPRHRFMSAYEQKVEAADRNYQYLIFACEPYSSIAFKIPSQPIDKAEDHTHKKKLRNIAAPQINHDHGQHRGIYAVYVDGKSRPFNADEQMMDHRNHKFDDLEDLSAMAFNRYVGPTPESNWVIPGRLLVGAYPASRDDHETAQLLTSIMKYGVTKFVCLQQEYKSHGVTEEMWRSGQGLRPYFEDVKNIMTNPDEFDLIPEEGCSIPTPSSVSFVHFPIKDCGITDDDRVIELSRSLVKSIASGEIMYLHCWGGHGRTGTIVSIMLHLMYNLSSKDAMARCQKAHDMREYPVEVGSPQTQQQRDQVSRVVKKIMSSHHVSPIGTFIHKLLSPNSKTHISVSNKSSAIDESSLEEKGYADTIEDDAISAEDQDNLTNTGELIADILGDQPMDIDSDNDDIAESMDIVSIDLPPIDNIIEADENKPLFENSEAIKVEVAPTVCTQPLIPSKNKSSILPRLKIDNTSSTSSTLPKSTKSNSGKESTHRPISPTKSPISQLSKIRNRVSYPVSPTSKDPSAAVAKFTSGSPRPKETSLTKHSDTTKKVAVSVTSKDGISRKPSLSSMKDISEHKIKPPPTSSPMPPPHRTQSGIRSFHKPQLQPSSGSSKSSTTSSKGSSKNEVSRSFSPQPHT